jgi:hypothetical protein
MQDNVRQSLLDCYGYTVRSLTRITGSAKSLIDVIIINKDNPEFIATVKDLGFSDHLAQILRVNGGIGNMRCKIVITRQFTKNSVEELKNLLSKGSWYEVFNHLEVNSFLKAFMDIFLYCFNIAVSYKSVKSRKLIKDGCLMDHCIKQKNATLKHSEQKFNLKREALDYIKKYQGIY